jgi:hypothetical protein
MKTKSEHTIKDQCLQCLRNVKGECLVLKERQYPCWAYIDDENELKKREKERAAYLTLHINA